MTEHLPSKDWMARWSALQLAQESTQGIAASTLFCEVVAELERYKRELKEADDLINSEVFNRVTYKQQVRELQRQLDEANDTIINRALPPLKVTEWLPIETAPSDGRYALVYRPLAERSHDNPVDIKRLIGGNSHCWECTVPPGQKPYNPTDGACHVTHWMPLPAGPSQPPPVVPSDPPKCTTGVSCYMRHQPGCPLYVPMTIPDQPPGAEQ